MSESVDEPWAWGDPDAFAQQVLEVTLLHAEHGGWVETPEGLRCRQDMKIVTPAPPSW